MIALLVCLGLLAAPGTIRVEVRSGNVVAFRDGAVVASAAAVDELPPEQEQARTADLDLVQMPQPA